MAPAPKSTAANFRRCFNAGVLVGFMSVGPSPRVLNNNFLGATISPSSLEHVELANAPYYHLADNLCLDSVRIIVFNIRKGSLGPFDF